MSEISKTEILPPDNTHEYPVLAPASNREILNLIDENLGGQNFSILSLPRIKVPSGGDTSFLIETAAGNEHARKLTGVISSWRSVRVYWKSRAAGKKPPDCTSQNGFMGVGDPGGECRACPYARFGSGIGNDGQPTNGQACKDIRQVLFLLPGEILPHLLHVPPTSIKAFGQYTLTLLSSRAAYWGATTELTLDTATSDAGQPYARIVFRLGRRLDPKEQAALEPYHKRMKDLLVPSIIDASAYDVEEESGRAITSTPKRFPGAQPPTDQEIPF